MQRSPRAQNLLAVANALSAGDHVEARRLAKDHFPWSPSETKRGLLTRRKALEVFRRDRFTDRYSGSRLVYPGALLAIGKSLRDDFPIHPTWRVSSSHEVFWELWPVVDHVVPVTRHGTNDLENLATTSARNNCAKGTSLLHEIGWTILPIDQQPSDWDGMLTWFRGMVAKKPQLLENAQLRAWHKIVA